jgi:hypothetical protein
MGIDRFFGASVGWTGPGSEDLLPERYFVLVRSLERIAGRSGAARLLVGTAFVPTWTMVTSSALRVFYSYNNRRGKRPCRKTAIPRKAMMPMRDKMHGIADAVIRASVSVITILIGLRVCRCELEGSHHPRSSSRTTCSALSHLCADISRIHRSIFEVEDADARRPKRTGAPPQSLFKDASTMRSTIDPIYARIRAGTLL